MEQEQVTEQQEYEAVMDKKLTILVTPEQRQRYHIAAATAGVTLSDVVRDYLDQWSERILDK